MAASVPSRIGGPLEVIGDLSISGSLGLPVGTVANAGVNADAAIAVAKLRHRYQQAYSQEVGTKIADESRIIHCAKFAGTIEHIQFGSATLGAGSSTVTIDLRKHTGATDITVLSAVITLDSANSIYVLEAGAISVAAYVAGDVFEIRVNATDDGGNPVGNGLFGFVTFDEAGQ